MAYISFKPSAYFNITPYTGNNSTNAITGVGFQPDWVWTKNRGSTGSHMLFDALRGATYRLSSDTTETNYAYANGLTSFDSDGFTLGDWGGVNSNSNTFISWNWKANGTGSANTTGTINSTATSANTTAGFSIVKWTGTGSAGTIGHGLGAVPKSIWMKRLDSTAGWVIYHKDRGANKYLRLNTNDGEATDTNIFNNTAPTSTVFSVGTDTDNNGSGGTYIAYCFAEVPGFSKFGFYRGNNNANGAFIYTGFKPAWFMIKRSTSGYSWAMKDNVVNPRNPVNIEFYANDSSAETSGSEIDFLSNGVKVRSTSGTYNHNAIEYIYLAFAEAPIVASNGDPDTAR